MIAQNACSVVENWQHLLAECGLYEYLRDLTAMGLPVDVDGNALLTGLDNSVAFNEYAKHESCEGMG